MKAIRIAGKVIKESACFVIAEAGVNHNGELRKAFALVDAARQAGADAVKFQTFRADGLVTRHAPGCGMSLGKSGNRSQWKMLRRLELSETDHAKLAAYCRQRKIIFLSTPFDEKSADLLDALRVPAFKIPSGEITNLPLLKHIAKKGKPLIVSTGMCRLSEIRKAVSAIRKTGNQQIVLLHCVSLYPAAPHQVNLRAIAGLKRIFGVSVGYSDHTLETDVALAAVALGAVVIEKHLTLNRRLPGPDQAMSIEPVEFRRMVDGIRNIQVSLGDGVKRMVPGEARMAARVRKSIVAAEDIPSGKKLTEKMLTLKRPGTGLPPGMRSRVVGRVARTFIAADTVLSRAMFR